MLFKIHYWFHSSGIVAIGSLLGVYVKAYTDASVWEVGALFMLMPFMSMLFRPIICSFADRGQAHQKYLALCQLVVGLAYFPFAVVPLFGPALYSEHGRLCWYIFVTSKIIGDIAVGGVKSLGDALTVNYATRVGADFSLYRVWGTISAMCFSIIIGQVNEVWFLPKYVPGFIILIGACLADTALVWFWPSEYFEIVATSDPKFKINCEAPAQKNRNKWNPFNRFSTNQMMSSKTVWLRIKAKVKQTCSCSKQEANQVSLRNFPDEDKKESAENKAISKKTQMILLKTLIMKDPRIVLYLLYFTCAGAASAPYGFFFMSLASICHEEQTCNFSELAGFIQFFMAVIRTTVLLYIKSFIERIGRVNTCALAMSLVAFMYLFLGTIWRDVDPHYSILAGLLHGTFFIICVVLPIQVGHMFSNEVDHVVPDLIKKGVIGKEEAESGRLRSSLAATMQSLIASAQEGFGKGFASLLFGVLLEYISYESLWLMIGLSCSAVCLIALAISILDGYFDFALGLDVKAGRKQTSARELEEGDGKPDEAPVA